MFKKGCKKKSWGKALKRAEGQVRGVAKMLAEDKPCLAIVQQIAAARAALGRVGRELLKEEATKCIVDKKEKDKFERILERLFKS